jgi:hypothetical protein
MCIINYNYQQKQRTKLKLKIALQSRGLNTKVIVDQPTIGTYMPVVYDHTCSGKHSGCHVRHVHFTVSVHRWELLTMARKIPFRAYTAAVTMVIEVTAHPAWWIPKLHLQ